MTPDTSISFCWKWLTRRLFSLNGTRFLSLIMLVLLPNLASGDNSYKRHGNCVICDNVRFQILSPTLVRLEYSSFNDSNKSISPDFIDAPSISVLKRNWPENDFQISQESGWLNLDTGEMNVRYLSGSGPFTSENLSITWKEETKTRRWKPGDSDPENLGGTLRCMDSAEKHNLGNYEPLPGLLSRSGYFFLDDSLTPLLDEASNWVATRPEGGQDWFFLVYGQNYRKAFKDYCELTGPIPMLPRFALGYWFGSRMGYSALEWIKHVDRFREEDIPLDVVMFDSSWATHIWSNYDWDPVNVPDPETLTATLHSQGVKLCLVTHYGPLILDDASEDYFKTFVERMGLSADTEKISVDLGNELQASLLTDHALERLYDDGVDFFFVDGAFGNNIEGLNPQLWTNRVVYKSMEDYTGKRGLIISRYGGWGSHRYPVFITGDVWSQWEVFNRGIEFINTSGNSLMPYWIHLMGGFLGALDVEQELYVRWIQGGSFSPIAMSHGINGRRMPWEYGQEGIDTFHKYMKLRYRLIPYSYTFLRIAHDTGLPLQRPLYIEYPEDDAAYRHPCEYFWGKDFLVAPVVRPCAPNQSLLKTVYLPQGTWFDYATGEVYDGGQVIHYSCPRDRLPLFVRSGSILPMQPDMAYTDELPLDPLILEVYAGESVQFDLYEDDGISLAYKEGEYSWTPLRFEDENETPRRYVLTIGPPSGNGFRGQLSERGYRVIVHGLLRPSEVKCDGETLGAIAENCDTQGWSWNSRQMITTINIPARPIHQRTEIILENPGSFKDYAQAKKLSVLRLRLRDTNQTAKVEAFKYLGGYFVKTMPKVMRAIESVQYRLEELLEHPAEISEKQPDLAWLVQGIVPSILNKPCDVTRETRLELIQLTDVADDGIRIGQKVEFPEKVQQRLINQLFDFRAFAYAEKIPNSPNYLVTVLVGYDKTVTGTADVTVEVLPMMLPDWWIGDVTNKDDDGTWEFQLGPSWTQSSPDPDIQVVATLRWKSGETRATCPVDLRKALLMVSPEH